MALKNWKFMPYYFQPYQTAYWQATQEHVEGGTHTGGLQRLDVVCSTCIMANLFFGVGELYCRLEILTIFEQSFYVIDSDKI